MGLPPPPNIQSWMMEGGLSVVVVVWLHNDGDVR